MELCNGAQAGTDPGGVQGSARGPRTPAPCEGGRLSCRSRRRPQVPQRAIPELGILPLLRTGPDCVPHTRPHTRRAKPHFCSDGIWSRGRWEVLEVKWGHERGTRLVGTGGRGRRQNALSASGGDTRPGRGAACRTPPARRLGLPRPASRTVRRRGSVVERPGGRILLWQLNEEAHVLPPPPTAPPLSNLGVRPAPPRCPWAAGLGVMPRARGHRVNLRVPSVLHRSRPAPGGGWKRCLPCHSNSAVSGHL